MKHERYEWEGREVTPFEFWRLAQAKWKWRGLRPSPLVGYKSPNGDKGCVKNPDAPPARMCDLIGDAFMDMSAEQRQTLKDEAHIATHTEKEAV